MIGRGNGAKLAAKLALLLLLGRWVVLAVLTGARGPLP